MGTNFVGVAGVVVKDVDKIILIGKIGDVTGGCVEDMITSSFVVVDSVVKIGAEKKEKESGFWFKIKKSTLFRNYFFMRS